MIKLNAKQLRTQEPDPEVIKKIKKNPIFIILDNVYDTYNVGAIFRLADAVAVKKVFLCGNTETPPNPRIKKASINTWQWVEWEYFDTAKSAINSLKKQSTINLPRRVKAGSQQLTIVAIDQHSKSIPLAKFKPDFPLAIVVGNETYGVSPEVLKMADQSVELPRYGINNSLNVMMALEIVLYHMIE